MCVIAAVDTSNGADQVANTTSAADGTYHLAGLPPTPVNVGFQDCNNVGPYVEQWWDNQPDESTATPVALDAGQTRSGIDAQLAAAAAITGTVTDANSNPLEGICVQATTTTFFGGLAHTDSQGSYVINLAHPGAYRVQFVDCNQNPVFAGQWWDHQTSPTSAQPVTVTAGQVVTGIDARLTPGPVGSISGKVVNLGGLAMTTACVIAYLPNQYALFAPVNPDGTYTVANVPSGTYALAFVGCGGGDPQATVPDPAVPATTYTGAWWNGPILHLDSTNNGGPDPIAQGAHLVTITPGQHLTGYDHCFGCTAISLTTITPGPGSVTVDFTTPGLVTTNGVRGAAVSAQANPPTYTYNVTCTSTSGGTPGTAHATSSPITVTGLTPGATYACLVTAAEGTTTIAASAVSGAIVIPAPTTPASTPTATPASTQTATPASTPSPAGSGLARTGTSAPTTLARTGLALLAVGLALLTATRRRRRSPTTP